MWMSALFELPAFVRRNADGVDTLVAEECMVPGSHRKRLGCVHTISTQPPLPPVGDRIVTQLQAHRGSTILRYQLSSGPGMLCLDGCPHPDHFRGPSTGP